MYFVKTGQHIQILSINSPVNLSVKFYSTDPWCIALDSKQLEPLNLQKTQNYCPDAVAEWSKALLNHKK